MNMQEFLQLLIENSELAQKMDGAANPDEAYAIAKEAGLTDSFEVFTDTMTKLYKAQSELSEEELDAVVGGSTFTDITMVVSMGTLATMITGAGAAAV